MNLALKLAERQLLNDDLIRTGMRKLMTKRINNQISADSRTTEDRMQALQAGPVAVELSNEQDILELGSVWGSLSLWMAEHYPKSSITSVSNSNPQREFIEGQAKERSLNNRTVSTCHINEFKPNKTFDRLVPIELFEHVRKHSSLFKRIHQWLKEDGKIFIHIIEDWMTKYFFTGGIMPSVDLLPTAAEDFTEEARWEVYGGHYSKTLEVWLEKKDSNKPEVLEIFKTCYDSNAKRWIQRWRMFYMACSELFAYNDGTECFVMHYRFAKPT
ncbi:MAG: SAM-dependent methyltransferase [Lentimonas sp.]